MLSKTVMISFNARQALSAQQFPQYLEHPMCIVVSQGPNHCMPQMLGLLQGFHIFQVHFMSKEWMRTLACPHTLELCRSHEAWSILYVQSSWRSRFCFTPDEMSSKKWQGGH